jgi:predicted Rossmann fold nucleotide-binding protein DprA/Smf involved in DNA uptake
MIINYLYVYGKSRLIKKLTPEQMTNELVQWLERLDRNEVSVITRKDADYPRPIIKLTK